MPLFYVRCEVIQKCGSQLTVKYQTSERGDCKSQCEKDLNACPRIDDPSPRKANKKQDHANGE